jgi:hypothetical protein
MQVSRVLYRHPRRKMPQLQLWNESPVEANAISHENWDCPKRASSKYLLTNSLIYKNSCETQPASRRSSSTPIIRVTVMLLCLII